MGQIERKMIRDMGLPQDSKFIRIGKEVVGIKTSDKSFDYSPEGEIFLAGKKKSDTIK